MENETKETTLKEHIDKLKEKKQYNQYAESLKLKCKVEVKDGNGKSDKMAQDIINNCEDAYN